jgi:hypothetical protein
MPETKRRNKRRSPIDLVSSLSPKLPVNFSQHDVVPHMITRSPRLRLAKFVLSDTKRLLQHNLPRGEIAHDSQTPATAVIDARAVRNGDCQFDGICAVTYPGGVICT